jgi:hypothetical protein
MATIDLRHDDETSSMPDAERHAAALRPVARWVLELTGSGRHRLVMAWAVPQCPNIAAVVDSTSAY